MDYEFKTVEEYLEKLPEDRREIMEMLRELILSNLPEGFVETISYGMISYVVPHSIYPKGYHVNPKEPLPFMSLASQKNHIAIYHSGIYMIPELEKWFREEYSKRVSTKLDIGKSCIRFKNPKKIPYELLEELFMKISVGEYVDLYEKSLRGKG
ncbi:iron chaperone [Gudongella sp. SC589]|uniref:iron chaperone n=1 Tax=Gudongella sp. SC589 TaxID=3385990 RepID=UPI0039047CB7